MFPKMKAEIQEINKTIEEKISESIKCTNDLEKLALKPIKMDRSEYIQTMIDVEK